MQAGLSKLLTLLGLFMPNRIHSFVSATISSLLVTPSWRSSWLDYKQTISGEIFWDVKLSKTLFKLSFCFWSTLSISQFAAILIIILVSTKVKSAETFWFFVRTKCFLLISLKTVNEQRLIFFHSPNCKVFHLSPC